MSDASEQQLLDKYNNFEKISETKPHKEANLQGLLKVTQINRTDIFDDDGNRLTFKDKKELYNELCMRT